MAEPSAPAPRDAASHPQNDVLSSTTASSDVDIQSAATAHEQSGFHSFVEGVADTEELHKIATTLSRHRSVIHPRAHDHLDPALDPESDRFDLSKWVEDFITHLQPGDHAKDAHPSVSFSNLSVFGTGSELQLQASVSDVFMSLFRPGEVFSFGKAKPKQILHNFNGLLKSGELLVVLGRPGSGCSTFLKSICGELHGLHLDEKAAVHYNGIPQHQMVKEFKGEVVYNQEVDKHFPHLTVGQTLEFAATVRTPATRIENMSRAEYCRYMAKVVMAIFGLSHTYHTKVGDDFIRGVSGGERKRVSIAEMFLAGSPICAWDNSTRGLDSSSALKFVQALRMSSNMGNHAHAVAIYQASQAIYDEFDKATVLYEGRQIYFGSASMAKCFFERQGWYCPPRQTTGDFLTAVTNPHERQARDGMEHKVPRTAEEFERYWHGSPEYKALQEEIEHYEQEFRGERKTEAIAQLREQKERRQAKHVRPKSPYTISIAMQIKACTVRAYQRIWGDRTATFTMMFANLVLALIIGSIFYGNPDATAGFAGKGSVLFMAILLNALTAITEINSLYAQRPMVEKHASFAFYHPACEAAAGIVADIPIKFATATIFNILVYFLAGLRREPGQFFLYFIVSYLSTFTMSAFFRTIAASTKTVSQALALAGVLVLALIIYTGYIVPVPEMKPWFGWIRWINPIFYGFEILIANEFHGREFTCSSIVPPYPNLIGNSWICASTGAVAGRATVSGDQYMKVTYGYSYSHVWRNFGILWAFLVGFMVIYFLATELNSSNTSTAEALVFRRAHVPSRLQQKAKDAEKSGDASLKGQLEQDGPLDPKSLVDPQTDIFTWEDVVYDIDYQGGQRRLLDHVNGWVKPGTLTALMGASGAGKTTLLNVLAQRTTMGVVTGDMLVNGTPFGADFQRQTGYVQQQDLHLETATVRESLRFSAMLRRPKTVSKQEKYDYVEKVIKMLGMEDYADAVVGVPGEGLNVEQRKLLTIGVELVAKPKLLLFLDEPTSGLDSQSAWTICVFLRKLANAGQAILCTIHQPNAILFQQFDRLLFLAPGGKTVYFGQIGENSKTLLGYFESNGARSCGDQENPAEYMLEIVADGTNDKGEDWPSVWKASSEYQSVLKELDNIHSVTAGKPPAQTQDPGYVASEFAMPFTSQLWVVTERIFQQYWRMPAYIIAKLLLGVMSGLFVGFTFFKPHGTQAGMRNVVFSVFMITTLFTTLVQQIQPLFVTQRSLYEVRERPSKTYSWKAFLFANMFVEMPYQVLCGVLTYACFYYPVVGVQDSDRQGLVLLYMIQLFVYSSAFAQMTIAVLPDAQAASGIVILLTMMSTIFSGVLQTRIALPGFWTFMYRVSPFTYWIGGIVSTMLHDRSVTCSAEETMTFNPPQGMSCAQYLGPMLQQAEGVLQNPNATESCRYCAFSVADQYLVGVDIFWSERWRNWGLGWAYIVFDIVVAVVLYYVFRVRGIGRK